MPFLHRITAGRLVTEELDPGLHRWQQHPERYKAPLERFVEVLRSAIGSQTAPA